MNNATKRRWLGATCLLLATLFLLALLGATYNRGGAHRVRVTVFNVSDVVQVFVDCEVVAAVSRPGTPKPIDLGWVAEDELVTLHVRNLQADYTFGFLLEVDGEVKQRPESGTLNGRPGGDGSARHENQLVWKATYTGSGRKVANAGCQEARPAIAAAAKVRDGPHEPTDRRNLLLNILDAVGARIPYVFAVIGILTGLAVQLRKETQPATLALAAISVTALVTQGLAGIGLAAAATGGALLIFVQAIKLTLVEPPPARGQSPSA